MLASVETRSEFVMRKGAPKEFTGKPCKRGHIADRYPKGGGCVVCAAQKRADKDAVREKNKRYNAENAERIAADKKRYRAENKEHVAAVSRKWMAANRKIISEKAKDRLRQNRYGYPAGFAEVLRQLQSGNCAICSESMSGRNEHADHCHSTVTPRGLLCSNCNTGLGKFGDSEALLLKALEYLRNPPAQKASVFL